MKVLIKEKLSQHRYKDNHGYLICTDCIMARTGKQTYTRDECFSDGDNTEIEVDRKEEDVFNDKTLASFENVPITIEHPDCNVDPDNYNSLSVGHMRDIHKGMYQGKPVMLGTAVITDSDAIEKVESGELVNLSCGYDCDIADTENPKQTNIRGNHIALCQIPRAGITKIQDSLDRKRRTMKKDSLRKSRRDAFVSKYVDKRVGTWQDVLHIYLEWEGIFGYDSIIESYLKDEDFDGLRDYLEEEGIYGYDDTIIDIYETGEVNIPDMDEEDYEKFF